MNAGDMSNAIQRLKKTSALLEGQEKRKMGTALEAKERSEHQGDMKHYPATESAAIEAADLTVRDNVNDNDHSFSQPVHKALTCPRGQSAWAVALPG